VDGHQGQVHIGVHLPFGRPFAQEGFKDSKLLVGPCELQAEEHGHEHTHNTHEHTGDQELLSNHLVVLGEDVLRPEVFYVVLVIVVVSVVVSVIVRSHRDSLKRT